MSVTVDDKLDELKRLLSHSLIEKNVYDEQVHLLLSSHINNYSCERDPSGDDIVVEQNNTSNVEILLHNLSHSDLVFDINNDDNTFSGVIIRGRPKFNHYKEITENIIKFVESYEDCTSVCFHPKYIRQPRPGSDKYDVQQVSPTSNVALGYDFTNNIHVRDSSSIRFRRNDETKLFPELKKEESTSCTITSVYFPLISILVPKWLHNMESNGRINSRKVIILVTGRGTPRDSNESSNDNSTKYSGTLIKRFLNEVYPNIEVIHVHSMTNLFRYDENIVFVKRELLPIIHSFRDELSSIFGAKWRDAMKISLSFADGSSARISAINASLKNYRPSYMHFWQLKTFWSENYICDDDVEYHSFEEISTEPAVEITQTDSLIQSVVDEMVKFISDFRITCNCDNDLTSFWLRKTKKPVLAILLVQKPDGVPKLYRGTNMEVSMPTGSLCAERNVIGTALADDMTLKRQDLKLIAVYSANEVLDKEKMVNDKTPNLCRFITPTIDDDTLDIRQAMVPPPSPVVGHKRKIFNIPTQSELSIALSPKTPVEFQSKMNPNIGRKTIIKKTTPFLSIKSSASFTSIGSTDDDLNTLLCPELKTIYVEEKDMNPLRPCGACHEWLKKIAEVNPQFRVVTFTDAKIEGVYIDNINE